MVPGPSGPASHIVWGRALTTGGPKGPHDTEAYLKGPHYTADADPERVGLLADLEGSAYCCGTALMALSRPK